MCQAIPRRVLHVADGRAEVLYDGQPRWVNVRDIPDLAVGEYVIVYAVEALERVPVEEAEEMLRFFEEFERMFAAVDEVEQTTAEAPE